LAKEESDGQNCVAAIVPITLITKLNHIDILNGIKWSASLVFLVAYKINSEISLMSLALYYLFYHVRIATYAINNTNC
jgi:hypothetical protein